MHDRINDVRTDEKSRISPWTYKFFFKFYLRIVCAVGSYSTGEPCFCFDFLRNASRFYCILDTVKYTIEFFILDNTFNEIYYRYISFRRYTTSFGDKHYEFFFIFNFLPLHKITIYRASSPSHGLDLCVCHCIPTLGPRLKSL